MVLGHAHERPGQGEHFDEDGNPTRSTLDRFVTDVGEPNALGGLIDDSGLPTESAKQGIKRILNAVSAFVPHVIDIRKRTSGDIDLGPIVVDAVNMVRNGDRSSSDISMFGGVNPATNQIFEILFENKHSAVATDRVLQRFSEDLEASIGDGSVVMGAPLDMADAMQFLRRAQNLEIQRLIDGVAPIFRCSLRSILMLYVVRLRRSERRLIRPKSLPMELQKIRKKLRRNEARYN